VNLETVGFVWTGEFDLNTLPVEGKFLNPEESCGSVRRLDGALKLRLPGPGENLAIIKYVNSAVTLSINKASCFLDILKCEDRVDPQASIRVSWRHERCNQAKEEA